MLALLLYPLSWSHIYIPVLPEALLGVLAAPMPFLIGVHRFFTIDIHFLAGWLAGSFFFFCGGEGREVGFVYGRFFFFFLSGEGLRGGGGEGGGYILEFCF